MTSSRPDPKWTRAIVEKAFILVTKRDRSLTSLARVAASHVQNENVASARAVRVAYWHVADLAEQIEADTRKRRTVDLLGELRRAAGHT